MFFCVFRIFAGLLLKGFVSQLTRAAGRHLCLLRVLAQRPLDIVVVVVVVMMVFAHAQEHGKRRQQQ